MDPGRAGRLYDGAFGGKLAKVMPHRAKRLAILEGGTNLDHGK